MKKVAIGSDHAGFELKEKIIEQLNTLNVDVQDLGTNNSESVDYPDFAHPVAKLVNDGKSDLGILICGSGNGVNMAANKHANIRSALSWNPEIAELARTHNNANVLALPARFISEETAKEIVEKFLTTEFEGGRHERRTQKI